MTETWRAIDGFEGLYEVSNEGRIRSLKRRFVAENRILKATKMKIGYHSVRLAKDGVITMFYLHRLVASAHVGTIADGMTINHKDGDKSNNHADNLEIISRGDNIRHAIATGLMAHGRLLPRDVEEILAYQGRMSSRKVAKLYHVSHSNILQIWRGEIWREDEGSSKMTGEAQEEQPILPDGLDRLYIKLDKLVVFKANYNQGNVGGIMSSILEFGYDRTIAVWKDYTVMAGNHTLLALRWIKKEGYWPEGYAPDGTAKERIFPNSSGIIVRDGVWYILTSDCSHLVYEKAVGFAIADNAWARQSIVNEAMLVKHLKDVRDYAKTIGSETLQDATGYDDDELELLVRLVREDNPPSAGSGNSDDTGDGPEKEGKAALEKPTPLEKRAVIRVEVSLDTFNRFHALMTGAEEAEHGERLAEILSKIEDEKLSWWEA